MTLYNICTKREYEKDGEKKTIWLTVGTLKELDGGKKFIELNMWPNESFYVFEQKPRESKLAEVTIDDNDIPFN